MAQNIENIFQLGFCFENESFCSYNYVELEDMLVISLRAKQQQQQQKMIIKG